MNKLEELRKQFAEKQNSLYDVYKRVKSGEATDEEADSGVALATEVSELRDRIEKLEAVEAAGSEIEKSREKSRGQTPDAVNELPVVVKDKPKARSLEEIFTHSDSYRAYREGKSKHFELTMTQEEFHGEKAIVTLGTISPRDFRMPGILGFPEQAPTIADMLASGTIDVNALSYYEELAPTENATTVAEGGVKPESGLDFIIRNEVAAKIATWIPATDELLADMPAMLAYIQNRLRTFVLREEERQILDGDGTGTNMTGILNRSGVQTQAVGTGPVPDALFRAMTLVRVNAFEEPTGVVMNPLDWQNIRLLTTADGVYIWGPPMDNGPERIWGIPVRQTSAIPQGTAVVITRSAAQVFRRTPVQVATSSEHADYFIRNQLAIRAEERILLAVYRPAAFVEVTGLPLV